MKHHKPYTGKRPLTCWDIFMDGYNRRIDLADDISLFNKIIKTNRWELYPEGIISQLVWMNKTVIITDPHLTIVYATQNINAMTGYKPDEVIGKTPHMFQGPQTETIIRNRISQSIYHQTSFDVAITNYKKDGSIYRCHIEGYPVFNIHQQLINFVALENVA